MIEWNRIDEQYFTTGTDRGVLYPKGGSAVPWDGIIGVTEAGAGSTSVLYRDGNIFYSDVEPGDYSGSLTAFFWPNEFSACLGIPEIAPGLYADYQKPKPFDLSYRVLIGSGGRGDLFGYQIHLVYNAKASINQRTRKTMTESPSLDEYGFDIVATPTRVRGYRPTSHFIIDTRNLAPGVINEIENTLYEDGIMPDPEALYELLKFGDSIIFTDLGNGRIRVSGSSSKIIKNSDGRVAINGVNGVLEPSGKYIISDTP